MTSVLSILMLAACAASPESAQRPQTAFLSAAALEADGTSIPAVAHLSSGQPTASVLEKLAEAGYAGVIDLRTAAEPRGLDEAATAAALGLRYESLPVAGAADVTYKNAAALNALLASFDGPVLLHCASGNRVGALFALRAKAAGADNEEALVVGRAAGLTDLEGVVRDRLTAAD